MDKKKHYLVYKTTCLINGKIYIGQHQTYDPNDNYLGSGKELREDIEKFGKENFKKEILFDFDTFKEMDDKERELVTEEFINRDDTYNLMIGGQNADWYAMFSLNRDNPNKRNGEKGLSKVRKMIRENTEFRAEWIKRVKLGIEQAKSKCPEKFTQTHWIGRHHSEETKQKIREKALVRIKEYNHSIGKVWIFNESLKVSKMVKKEFVNSFLNDGWKLGRKMSFNK